MIKDNYNRIHNYLRISLTDNCNLRCFYCMPDEDYQFAPKDSLMSADEIFSIAKIFVDEGVNKIRLTGGEPLVRKDFKVILQKLSTLGTQITITTNATRLHEHINDLKSAGVQSLNISLDTLQRDRFIFLTKRDQFDLVKRNIQLMLENGFQIKINVVVMKGINDAEIYDFIEWTRDTSIQIRFIEFMPFDGNRWQMENVFTLEKIINRVKERYDIIPVPKPIHETAKSFLIPGYKGNFAVISTMSSPFCSDCNRMRLTADGKLKNCLFSDTETDILTAYRGGQDIRSLIHKNISNKKQALGGQLTTALENIKVEALENRSMISIGG